MAVSYNNLNPENANFANLLAEAMTIPHRNLTREHVQVLPRRFILSNLSAFTLVNIWDDLPKNIQQDPEVQSHLPCLEHYNRPEETVHIDGPPPPKYRCRGCIWEKMQAADNSQNNINNTHFGRRKTISSNV